MSIPNKPHPIKDVLRIAFRILTFRATREELQRLELRHLAFGLLCTWLVGIGRWWDDPGAHPLQHLGLGSLAYVFVLSGFLWLLLWPLRPQDWSYRRLLTYVSLTSPPAALYALPVERWYGLDIAAQVNVWFLAAVAVWRVALLAVYLRRLGRFGAGRTCVGVLLPIMLIIASLAFLNLERGVFEIMGGLRQRTAADDAYGVLLLLTFLSFWGGLPVLIWYCGEIQIAWGKTHETERPERPPG
ncbi:MAG TPA: hypothetical protein VK689_13585 [Armatimonadota bacterium]|nr:hypothetical protein [Armatimonadota bacterium]